MIAVDKYQAEFPLFYLSFLRKVQCLSSQVNDLADLEWPSTFFHRYRWARMRHFLSEFFMDGPKPEPKLRKRVSVFSNPGLEAPVLAQPRRKRTTTGGRAWSHGRGLPVLPHHPPFQAVNSHRPARPKTGTGRAGFHGKFQLSKIILGFCSVFLFVKGWFLQ